MSTDETETAEQRPQGSDPSHESLVDEVADYLEGPFSPMIHGAWGIRLVRVFADREDRYPAFRRFLDDAFARYGTDAKIIARALRSASLDGEQATLRRHYLASLSNALMDFRARRAGWDPD